MKVSNLQYAQALLIAIDGQEQGQIKDFIHNFVVILDRNNDLYRIPGIIKSLIEIWNKKEGILEVDLIISNSLSDSTKNLLIDYLKNKVKVQKIKFSEKIDSNILGGFIARYNSQVLDASLKNNLISLHNKISN